MSKPPLDAGHVMFARGFVLYPVDAALVPGAWQELSHWKESRVGSYILRYHPSAQVHSETEGECSLILIGNAVNPFDGNIEPGIALDLVKRCAAGVTGGQLGDDVLDYIDQLTGRFQLLIVEGVDAFACCDAIGLVPLYYCWYGNKFSFASHSQLLADVLGVKRDPEVQEVIDSPFFMIGRRHLPGYKSPYKGVEMVGSNVYFSTRLGKRVRFFPRKSLEADKSMTELVNESVSLLRRTAEIYTVSRQLLVSLSMGQDSRIGLAALHEHKQKIATYSYCGDPVETAEAIKVHEFAKGLGVKHNIIGLDHVSLEESQALAKLLDHSSAYMRKHKSFELKKLVAMSQWFPEGAIEAKGEASEIGRATYSKRYAIKRFPPISPRAMSNLYKRVLYPRRLLNYIDGCFEEFCYKSGFNTGFSHFGYDDYDLFFWEHRNACCVALGMQDHDIYHDSTALMNNRRLLQNFLAPSFEDRLHDRLHREVCEELWPSILNTPTSKRTSAKARAKVLAENLFFKINRF